MGSVNRRLPQIEMRQVYGQTETVSIALAGARWEVDDRRSIGRPALGIDAVKLVDEAGHTVYTGVPGELLAFVGRRMHIIRLAGENISSYELELMMQNCPLIEDAAVRESIDKRRVPDSIRTHKSFPRTPSGRVIAGELDAAA